MAEQEETTQHSAKRIGIREFRGNFSGFMRQVRHGASFIVTSHDEAVAIILPPQSPAPLRRQPGSLRGNIHMTPDFDTLPVASSGCGGGQRGLRLLLDRHALLWLLSDDAQLGQYVRDLTADPANDTLISVASLFEIQVKVRVGKLTADMHES